MNKSFSANLRSICAEYGSVSKVCREIGMNRQQFNRYVNDGSVPSSYNLRRIARFFDVLEADLLAGHDEFTTRYIQNRNSTASSPSDLMLRPFKEQANILRRYLGFYHSHFQSPSWEGMILRSLVWLYEKDGYVMTRTLEHVTSNDGNRIHRSRYEGMAAQRGDRIFVVENEMVRDGSITEIILTPSHREQVKYLRGKGVGVALQTQLVPYTAVFIWKKIDERISARAALNACGVFPIHSRDIEPTIRSYLLGE